MVSPHHLNHLEAEFDSCSEAEPVEADVETRDTVHHCVDILMLFMKVPFFMPVMEMPESFLMLFAFYIFPESRMELALKILQVHESLDPFSRDHDSFGNLEVKPCPEMWTESTLILPRNVPE